MAKKFTLYLMLVFTILFSGCVPLVGTLEVGVETPAGGATDTPELVVTAQPTQESEAISTPTATTGTVSGRVCYPSEFIPTMTAYFQEIPSGEIIAISIMENQTSYLVDLAPGTYRAFAWVEKFKLGGAYTAYVACGFGEECTDHSLQPFEVLAGQETANIDICDWPLLAEQLPLPQSASGNDPSLEGLIYSTQEGTHFRIGPEGIESNIYSGLGMVISPDGSRGLYFQENDLWIINLSTGEQYNLTNTPDIVEILYQWPVADTIFFTSLPAGQEGGPGATGGLYTMLADGTGFGAIDSETNAGNFSVSADGRFVAYGAGPFGFIYDLDLNQHGTFDPATFGLSSPEGLFISSPSWSPNGQKIAWIAQGNFLGQSAFATVVFDLTTSTYEIIHPYQILGMDGFLPAARFSPDGRWIAFQAFDSDNSRNGVWVASVGDPNQSTEFFMGTYTAAPHWSPNGRYLIFSQYLEAEQAQRLFLYDIETNNILLLNQLPLNVNVVAWR